LEAGYRPEDYLLIPHIVLNVICVRVLVLQSLARSILVNLAAAILPGGGSDGIIRAVRGIARTIHVGLILLLALLIDLTLAATA